MTYSYLELLSYLIIYSMLGWAVETCVVAVSERRFCNRGFLSLPMLLSRGITMVLLIILLPTLVYHYILQFIVVLVISSVVEYISNHAARRLSRKGTFGYSDASIFEANVKGFLYSMILAGCYYAVYLMIHPFIFLLIHMIPATVAWIACIILLVLMLADLISIIYAVQKNRKRTYAEEYQKKHLEERKRLGEKLYRLVWDRIDHAYPDMETQGNEQEKYVFAKGICPDKVIWIFFICCS